MIKAKKVGEFATTTIFFIKVMELKKSGL